MATHTRIEVIGKVRDTGLVAVFYHPDAGVVKEVLRACYEGGIRVFEFTNRGDMAQEVFGEAWRYARANLPDLALGVGSVPDAATAVLYMQMGASFVAAPTLDPWTARMCNRRKVLWIPGCGSMNEIQQAHELGAEFVKIFPAAPGGGPAFVRNVLGPMPWSSLLPDGGVSPDKEDLSEWFEAGVVAVGMGSKLFTREILARKDYALLEEKVKELLFTLREVKGEI